MVDQLDYKLETMPGIGLVTVATLIAEIGDVRRFSSAEKLTRNSGIAPILESSGGKIKLKKSKRGNRTLHQAFFALAIQPNSGIN